MARTASPIPSRPRRRPLGVEALEDRALLAVAGALGSGLTVARPVLTPSLTPSVLVIPPRADTSATTIPASASPTPAILLPAAEVPPVVGLLPESGAVILPGDTATNDAGPITLPGSNLGDFGAAVRQIGDGTRLIDRAEGYHILPDFGSQLRSLIFKFDRLRILPIERGFIKGSPPRPGETNPETSSDPLPSSASQSLGGGAETLASRSRRAGPASDGNAAARFLPPEEVGATGTRPTLRHAPAGETNVAAVSRPTESATWLTPSGFLLMPAAAAGELNRSVADVLPPTGLFLGALHGPSALILMDPVPSEQTPANDGTENPNEGDLITFPTRLPDGAEGAFFPSAAALLDNLPFDLTQLSRDVDAFFSSLTSGAAAEGLQSYARYGPWVAVLCAAGLGIVQRWDRALTRRRALAAEYGLRPDVFPDEGR